jgi:hypothetical protein
MRAALALAATLALLAALARGAAQPNYLLPLVSTRRREGGRARAYSRGGAGGARQGLVHQLA